MEAETNWNEHGSIYGHSSSILKNKHLKTNKYTYPWDWFGPWTILLQSLLYNSLPKFSASITDTPGTLTHILSLLSVQYANPAFNCQHGIYFL